MLESSSLVGSEGEGRPAAGADGLGDGEARPDAVEAVDPGGLQPGLDGGQRQAVRRRERELGQPPELHGVGDAGALDGDLDVDVHRREGQATAAPQRTQRLAGQHDGGHPHPRELARGRRVVVGGQSLPDGPVLDHAAESRVMAQDVGHGLEGDEAVVRRGAEDGVGGHRIGIP
jgi:hypothetical protein